MRSLDFVGSDVVGIARGPEQHLPRVNVKQQHLPRVNVK